MLWRLVLVKRLAAEAIGTALLLIAVIGSGIMGEHLAAGNVAVALLANSIATGGALLCLIYAFGPVSGAHFNPVVSLADTLRGGLRPHEAAAYALAQIAGAIAGAVAANAMFALPLVSISHHARSGTPILIGEAIATFGLLAVIIGCAGYRFPITPFAVGGYITGAYWFTSSTSFANPAVTIARTLSDTFAGIRPQDAPAFIAVQILSALAATVLCSWLFSKGSYETQGALRLHSQQRAQSDG